MSDQIFSGHLQSEIVDVLAQGHLYHLTHFRHENMWVRDPIKKALRLLKSVAWKNSRFAPISLFPLREIILQTLAYLIYNFFRLDLSDKFLL
jgi:hypothetical protein